jgi:hypothetical protein
LSYHAGFVNLAGGMTAAVPVSPSAWQRLFEANQSEHAPRLPSRNDHTAASKTLRRKRPSRTSR